MQSYLWQHIGIIFLEEECLHKMTFLVLQIIDMPRISLVLRRDTEIHIMVCDTFTKCPFLIRPIRKNVLSF